MGGILLVLFIAALASPDVEQGESDGSGSQSDADPEPAPEPSPRFKAKALNYSVVNPATLNVVMEVRNTGDGPGSASCTVDASDASGAYSGFDIFEIGEIKPGKVSRGNGNLTIENEGAVFVTEVNIECSEE